MSSYYPLVLYAIVLVFSFLILRRKRMIKTHLPMWFFLAWLFPYTLHAAVGESLGFGYMALNILNQDEYIYSASIFFIAVLCSVIIYTISFAILSRRRAHDASRELAWANFTLRWWRKIRNHLIVVATLFFVLIMLTLARSTGSLSDSLVLRQESRGWTFVPAVLGPVLLFILLAFLESEGNTWRSWYLFIIQAIPSLIGGSKGGALMLIIAILVWALMRGKINLKLRYLVFLVFFAVPSITIGTYIRYGYEAKANGVDATAGLSFRTGVNAIISRFSGMDAGQIMIARPDTYLNFIPIYWQYAFINMIPSAFFPGKPLGPCLLVAAGLGYPGVACISESWLGGVMQYFGQAGLVIAPILVGITLSWFAKQFAYSNLRPSLQYPITFTFGWTWLSIVNEGTYYNVILLVISLALAILFIYLYILVLNGKIGVLPGFKLRNRVGVNPPSEK